MRAIAQVPVSQGIRKASQRLLIHLQDISWQVQKRGFDTQSMRASREHCALRRIVMEYPLRMPSVEVIARRFTAVSFLEHTTLHELIFESSFSGAAVSKTIPQINSRRESDGGRAIWFRAEAACTSSSGYSCHAAGASAPTGDGRFGNRN